MPNPPPPNVVVLTIEGLSKNLIGAFGSTIGRTPTLDRFAAWGLTLDQCFCDGPDLESNLHSLWTGKHALQHDRNTEETLWHLLAASEIPACLITDSHEVAEEATAMGCESPMLLGREPVQAPATTTDDCAAMRLFAAAAEELANTERQGLVWIHSSGLTLPWDAPLDLRLAFTDPDDPEPPQEIGPPAFEITDSTDPDKLTGWLQVAAAQVAMLDEGLEGLRQVIDSRSDADTWNWCILSPGGIHLGEAGYFGIPDAGTSLPLSARCTDNTVGVPALICQTVSECVGQRRSELYQLPDVQAAIAGLLGLDAQTPSWGRSFLESGFSQRTSDWPVEHQLAGMQLGPDTYWLRSPAWSALIEQDNCQLFVMPEDRWQVSNIAAIRQDICDLMRSSCQDFRTACESADRSSLPELPAELTNLIR